MFRGIIISSSNLVICLEMVEKQVNNWSEKKDCAKKSKIEKS